MKKQKSMNFIKWLLCRDRIKMKWDENGKYIRTTKRDVVKTFMLAGFKPKNGLKLEDLK